MLSALHHYLVLPAARTRSAILEHILRLRTQESASERADQTVIVFASEHAATNTAGYSSQKPTLALLRVVRVRWIALVAVWIAWIT